MSTQPIPITPEARAAADKKKKLQREDFRKDALFVAGALLCTVGAGMVRVWLGFLAAGAFCLLTPMLHLTIGFIRGLRTPAPRR